MTMRTSTVGMAALALLPTALLANEFEEHRDQATYGAWTVACMEKDTTGSVARTDCVARSESGLIYWLVDGEVHASVPDPRPGDWVASGVYTMDLSRCHVVSCGTGMTEAEYFRDRAFVELNRDGRIVEVPLAGLGEALREAIRLID